jgi:hypothetical protein
MASHKSFTPPTCTVNTSPQNALREGQPVTDCRTCCTQYCVDIHRHKPTPYHGHPLRFGALHVKKGVH